MFKNRFVIWIAIIIFGAIISQCSGAKRDNSGEITKSGDLQVNDTRVGDCFTDLPNVTLEVTDISSVKAISCDEPHSWQVFHKSSLTLDTYSEAAVVAASNQICDYAIENLIATLSDLQLNEYRSADINIIQPTSGSWAKGKKAVDCLIGSDTQIFYSSILN
jgi:hypothetical protein